MSRIDNENDVKRSEDSFVDSTNFLKIPEGKTPIYILSPDYSDGYVHWIKLPDGRDMRVVCGGGVDGKGFAPSECLICQYTVDLYREAKKLLGEGQKTESEVIKQKGNQARAKYCAEFIAVRGDLVYVKQASGKKKPSPDFEDCEVGVVPFSQKQYQDLLDLRKSDEYPFIKSGKDLVNRILILDKAKRDGSKYATIKFIPAKHPTNPPDVEWSEDDYGLESDFEVDTDEIAKVYSLLQGGDGEDGDLEFEEDDFEEEEKPTKKGKKDVAEEDDFEDDIPWDEEEEEKPTKKKEKKGRRR